MNQLDIIPKINQLCKDNQFSEAFNLCKLIVVNDVAIRCFLLVIESEKNSGKIK